jgi:Helix-turn-helix domain
MDKLADIRRFQEQQNIVLQVFYPISSGGFTQAPNVLLSDPKISANAKVVYAKLLSYAWNNDRVFPEQERMTKDIGLSQPTIARAVKELEDNQWLEIQWRGQGKTNGYILKYPVSDKKWSCYSYMNIKMFMCEILVIHPCKSEQG